MMKKYPRSVYFSTFEDHAKQAISREKENRNN